MHDQILLDMRARLLIQINPIILIYIYINVSVLLSS
jgi:hypothetical protein